MDRRMCRTGSLVLVAFALGATLAACDPPPVPAGEPDAGRADAGCPDDSDGDTIRDDHEGPGDPDGDGRPSRDDDDSDGDGALDRLEAGDLDCASPPIDTDGDGTPDFLDPDGNDDGIDDRTQHATDFDGDGIRDAIDLDVDDDTIANRHERAPRDTDGDRVPDVLDTDSDGDGVPDRAEAGDADLATPPVECGATDASAGVVVPDGAADAFDLDSDDDGLADGEEDEGGTHPCSSDSDHDGASDLIEVAYERAHCALSAADGCDCATRASCMPPSSTIVAVLPMGTERTATLTAEVTVRRADVFFAIDTTASMGGTLANVRATVSEIAARIATTIPDTWIGGGESGDFPFSSYGGASDRPFALGIGMTASARIADVRGAFDAMTLHGGGDGPEAHTEALFQIVTGAGGSWRWSDRTLDLPAHRDDCVAGTWGAPCFRDGSLPVIVLFTDTCSHGGPSDDDPACADYVGMTPAMASWDATMAELRNRGVTFVGVNAAEPVRCADTTMPDGLAPCWLLRRAAIETSSLDTDGAPLVYDLPNASESATFADTMVSAIEAVALRVPRDVDAVLRDPADALAPFRPSIAPDCDAAEPCWTAPAGTPQESAVERIDGGRFVAAVAGTAVRFRVSVRNDVYPGGPISRHARGVVDVRADAYAVLESTEILIAVPADDGVSR